MVTRTFDEQFAIKYGLEEAIVASRIAFWLNKNIDKKHYRDGAIWMYSSVREFSEIIPEMKPDTIRRAIESLIKDGLLLKMKVPGYGPVTWYTFTEFGILELGETGHTIWQKCQKVQEAFGKNAKSIWQNCQKHLAEMPKQYQSKTQSKTQSYITTPTAPYEDGNDDGGGGEAEEGNTDSVSVLKPDIDDVIGFARQNGAGREAAVEFYGSCDAENWLDGKGRPIISWKKYLLNWLKYHKPVEEDHPQPPSFDLTDIERRARSEIPSIDATPVVHGRWIEYQECFCGKFMPYLYTCSICGNTDLVSDKYCSSCGAKMDEGEGENV